MRRCHVIAVSALGMTFILNGCSARPPTGAAAAPRAALDWPRFLGPAGSGHSAETGIADGWPATGPARLWQRPVGEGFAGPVVAGNHLILFHRVDNAEVVEALDPLSGAGQWRHDYPCGYVDGFGKGNGPRATPVIDRGRVYTLGAEGVLNCLDLESGKPLWSRALVTEYHPLPTFFGIGTGLLVEGEVVLINVGAKQAGIVAFNRQTGKEVWRATDDQASYSTPIAATVDGRRLAFVLTRGELVALDPATGKVHYTRPFRPRIEASVTAATPVYADGKLFLSASYGAGALLLDVHKDNAREVWKGDGILSNHYTTSLLHEGSLYGFDGRQEQRARLRCVNFDTGRVRWTQEGFGCGAMIVADGKLMIVTEDGELVLVEATPEAYREKARARILDAPCRSPIALSGGRLYARDMRHLGCWDVAGR